MTSYNCAMDLDEIIGTIQADTGLALKERFDDMASEADFAKIIDDIAAKNLADALKKQEGLRLPEVGSMLQSTYDPKIIMLVLKIEEIDPMRGLRKFVMTTFTPEHKNYPIITGHHALYDFYDRFVLASL